MRDPRDETRLEEEPVAVTITPHHVHLFSTDFSSLRESRSETNSTRVCPARNI